VIAPQPRISRPAPQIKAPPAETVEVFSGTKKSEQVLQIQ
jgi:hypothetical protein